MKALNTFNVNSWIVSFISLILTFVLAFTVIPITGQNADVYAAGSDGNDSISSAISITKFGSTNKISGKFDSDTAPGNTDIFTAATGAEYVDVDYYSVTLAHRAPIYINISSKYANNAGSKYYGAVIIQSNKKTEIKQSSADKPSVLEYSSGGLCPAGTYYIAVYTDDTTKCWGMEYELYVENTADINATNVSYKRNVYYTGSKINFIKSVTYVVDGTVLVQGKDYEVKYSGSNLDVGSGTITIKGKGGFTGTRVLNQKYKILPNQIKIYKKRTTVSSTRKTGRKLTVKWKKIKAANYYQIKYRVKGAKKWSSKTVKGTKTSFTLTKLKKGKKYQYKVRGMQKLSGYKTYYSKFSNTKTSKKIK